MTTTKTCRRCGGTKVAAEFYARRASRDGLSSFCRRCHIEASIAWQQKNAVSHRERQAAYKRANRERINETRRAWYTPAKGRALALAKYRLTPETYAALLAAQGGGCALCGAHPGKRALHVDHDHACCPRTPTCGRCNRGLLCGPCNHAVAQLEADPRWTLTADSYLAKHKRVLQESANG